MDRNTTAVFIGHRDCYDVTVENIIPKIEEAISMGVKTFLNGGMGYFDHQCAIAVDRLKMMYPDIKQILIKPYPTLKVPYQNLFDDSGLFAFDWYIEHIGPRRAIPKRNEYMLLQSSIAICYVAHRSSGAYNTFQLAKQKGLRILQVKV